MNKVKRYALFPCIGLGDALISLIVSHNISKIGSVVDTYHPFIFQMEELFPELPLFPRPDPKEWQTKLKDYDVLIFFYEKTPWMEQLIRYATIHWKEKVCILNPIASPKTNYPFWEGGRFDGNIPFADNLVRFCTEILKIPFPTKKNGLSLPPHIIRGKYPKRIILHPTSSRRGKNWSPHKFINLGCLLKKAGFSPQLILTAKEKEQWQTMPHFSEIDSPLFENLTALTCFIAESGSFIGNDSGIGHLASCVGLSTLTICRSMLTARFWRPSWSNSALITPPSWVPNLKGIRLRDQKWQWFIGVKRVYREFIRFLAAQKNIEHTSEMALYR